MDYDFRNRINPQYDSQIPPMYRPPTPFSSSSHAVYGPSSLYRRTGHSNPHQAGRASSFHPSLSASSSSGLGIRVAIKPDYRITPPPQLSSQVGDIPRSAFQFDFELERKILAEAEKESQNWGRLGLENLLSKSAGSTSSLGSVTDPVVSKYVASGQQRGCASCSSELWRQSSQG